MRKMALKTIVNNRKIKDAFIYHLGSIVRITEENGQYILIGNKVLLKSSVRLVKVGDSLEFKNPEQLPDRCQTLTNMKITYIRENGTIGTDKDLSPSDGTNFSHFKKSK